MSVLFDTHAHLYLLKNRTPEEAVARAASQGVQYLTTVSTEPTNWESNRTIAHQFPNLYYTLGVHPHEAKDLATWKEPLRAALEAVRNDTKCVGVGETGLDFFYNHSEREIQLEAFEYHAQLANEFERTLIIHCRDSFPEVYSILRKTGIGKGGAIMHCFTGNAEQAKQALDLGLMISFSGIITFKNADTLRQAAKIVPLTSLLVETDCPFLTPVPHRGEANEPFYLPFTARVLSGELGITPERLAETTTQNALRTFGIVSR